MLPFQNSKDRLRKAIGLLGILLPFLVLAVHNFNLLDSISHYYYTSSSVIFTGFLSAFSIALLAYKGYPMDPERKEMMSDDSTTTFAAIAIAIAILIPTDSSHDIGILHFCGPPYLLSYPDSLGWLSTMHLVCAGVFLALLGYMSYSKFTLSPTISLGRKYFFKICGLVIWGAIALIPILFGVEYLTDKDLNEVIPGFTFWLESIAVWAFGLSWLEKGKVRDLFHSPR